MSKLVKIAIECPKCSHQYTGDFFRTIWGENEANRSMVMEDRINIAVWWEPNHDPGIDSDSASYAKMFGVNSYYAKAPRISDWEEFKRVVKEYDDGIRVGSPIEKMDFKALKGTMNQSKKSGCAGILLALIILSGVLVLL